MSCHVLLDGLGFPEGPRWHDDKWWFSDFFLGRVMTLDPAGEQRVIAEVDGSPSGIGWLPDGRTLVVSMLHRRIMVVGADGRQSVYAELSACCAGKTNDMVVDDVGRAYVGCTGDRDDTGNRLPATLAMVDTDGNATVVDSGLAFPNGAAITPDGSVLILAETKANRLLAFDRRPDGRLANKRVWAELGDVTPDGICLDAEGAVWVPGYRDGAPLLRVAEGGEILERVQMDPGRGAYACALGGDTGRSLLICTNVYGPQEETSRRDGRLEVIDVATPGAAWG